MRNSNDKKGELLSKTKNLNEKMFYFFLFGFTQTSQANLMESKKKMEMESDPVLLPSINP